MKLAVTDLGFTDVVEVAEPLLRNYIDYIEIIPTKETPYSQLTKWDFIHYKERLESFGLKPCAFLSLFYGIDIRSLEESTKFLDHIDKLLVYANHAGVDKLIFGSPGLRKTFIGWEEKLTKIFTYLDKKLNNTGKSIIIEPVARHYGGEFWYDIEQVTEFIQMNKLRNISTMIDTHNNELEGIDSSLAYHRFKPFIQHIHVSEIGLGKIVELEKHMKFSNAIRDYNNIVTHEMCNKNDFLESLNTFSTIYR